MSVCSSRPSVVSQLFRFYDRKSETDFRPFRAQDGQQARHQRGETGAPRGALGRWSTGRIQRRAEQLPQHRWEHLQGHGSRTSSMGLKAMFVDIGFEKNAFLHFWDAIPAALDSGIEEIDRPGRSGIEKADHGERYSEHLPGRSRGDRAGDKGPDRDQRAARHHEPEFRRAATSCFMPYSDRSGISRKIEEPKERDRLRKILRELEIPEGIGVIIRTVGEGQRARYFVRDLALSGRAMARDRGGDQRRKRAPLVFLRSPILWSARCAIF